MTLLKNLVLGTLFLTPTALISPAAYAMTGQEAYQNQCMACHGKTGDGDGPLARSLKAKPKAVKGLQRVNFEKALHLPMKDADGHGGFALLTPAERNELVEYASKLGK